MADETKDQRVSPGWVAEYLGLPSDDAAYREARLGRIPHVRLGRRVLFYRDQIERFRRVTARREHATA